NRYDYVPGSCTASYWGILRRLLSSSATSLFRRSCESFARRVATLFSFQPSQFERESARIKSEQWRRLRSCSSPRKPGLKQGGTLLCSYIGKSMHQTILSTFFEIPRTEVAMCAAGIALFVIGVLAAKHEIAEARGLDKIVALSNLCFAIPL